MRPTPLLPLFKPRKESSVRTWSPLECVWLMPEKSKEEELGVSSWPKWTRGCSLGSNFIPAMGKRFVSFWPYLRATCHWRLVSSWLRSCPRGATWREMGNSAKQAGNVLPDLRGLERCFKWPARRYTSTYIKEITKEKFPTTGWDWGSPKNPQKCSMRKIMSLNTCQNQIELRPAHDHISEVRILCPSLFFLPMLQHLGLETKWASQRRNRSAKQGKKKAPYPLQVAGLYWPNWREGKVGGLCFK